MTGFNDTLTGNLKKEIDRLSQYAKDLEEQASGLIMENRTLRSRQDDKAELIRQVLIASIRDDESPIAIANSIADILDISLLREITVTIPLTVEATMLVPIDFEIEHFEVGELNLDCYNTDVEDFCVQSFDVGEIEES
jgi:hypothetical protein